MSDLHSGSVITLKGQGDAERRVCLPVRVRTQTGLIPKKSQTFWGPRNPEPSQKSHSMFTAHATPNKTDLPQAILVIG